MNKISIILLLSCLLAACGQTTETAAQPPSAHSLPEQTQGYYCTMNLAEHIGPQGQILLSSKPDQPLWFSTVNQVFGFMQHPGEPKDVAAVYVSDLGSVADLGKPIVNHVWIDAKTAYYVIDSKIVGGMGAADAMPFADATKAQAFVQQHGGKVVRYDEIPDSYIYR